MPNTAIIRETNQEVNFMSNLKPLGDKKRGSLQGAPKDLEIIVEPPKKRSSLRLAPKKQKPEFKTHDNPQKEINSETNSEAFAQNEPAGQSAIPLTVSCPACSEINAVHSDRCWKCSQALNEDVKKKFKVRKSWLIFLLIIPVMIFFTGSFKTKSPSWNKLSNKKYLKLKSYREQIPTEKTNPPEKLLEGEWLGLWNGKKSFHLKFQPRYPSTNNYVSEERIDITYAEEGRVSGKGNVKVVNPYPLPKLDEWGKYLEGYIVSRNFIITPIQGHPGVLHLRARVDGQVREAYIYKISEAKTGSSEWGHRVEWYSIVKLIEEDEENLEFTKSYTLAQIGVYVKSYPFYKAEIYRVEEQSAAFKAGIRKGDIILSADGKTLESYLDWQLLKRQKEPEDKINLVVSRNGKRFKVSVKMHL